MSYCICCGLEFTPDKAHPYQKFFNEEHRKRFHHKKERALRTIKEREAREKITCHICGMMFTPTNEHRIYCSGECSKEAVNQSKKKELEILRNKSRKQIRYCKYCGIEFNPAITGRWKYCSNNHYFLDVFGREEPQERTMICEWCGKEFTTRHLLARGCCDKHTKKITKWERKQRMRAVIHVPYSRWEIFQRDNFTCHICGSPIDMDASAPIPDSPSIDHVIPINYGGADAPYNVKSAHFICNSVKSDRLMQ
jgi:5-methylcytosine-specific restriction endonuclease McrA